MSGDKKDTTMKEVSRYQCEFCKKDFKIPNRHQCKKDPALKNCFTCKNLKGWLESDDGVDVGVGFLRDPNYPDCTAGVDGWNIEDIKSTNYNMQCEAWEQGTYDWSKDQPQEDGLW